jgi:hypothetical protein
MNMDAPGFSQSPHGPNILLFSLFPRIVPGNIYLSVVVTVHTIRLWSSLILRVIIWTTNFSGASMNDVSIVKGLDGVKVCSHCARSSGF